jgi:hypothetical protein
MDFDPRDYIRETTTGAMTPKATPAVPPLIIATANTPRGNPSFDRGAEITVMRLG